MPPDSVLDPIFFIIYVKIIDENLPCKITGITDDIISSKIISA